MYACVLEFGRGFFEGVCSPCIATTFLLATNDCDIMAESVW